MRGAGHAAGVRRNFAPPVLAIDGSHVFRDRGPAGEVRFPTSSAECRTGLRAREPVLTRAVPDGKFGTEDRGAKLADLARPTMELLAAETIEGALTGASVGRFPAIRKRATETELVGWV